MTSPTPDDDRAREDARARVHRLARLMDTSVRLPGGFRIGVDGLVGLVPGIGDLATAAVSLSIVGLAARAGASTLVLARMVANLVVDAAIGAVPLVGDLFDFGFKANLRNAELMESHLERLGRGPAPPRD